MVLQAINFDKIVLIKTLEDYVKIWEMDSCKEYYMYFPSVLNIIVMYIKSECKYAWG